MDAKVVALLKSLFAVDEDGNMFIRVVEGEPKGDLKNAANTHSSRSLGALLSSCIVLDEDKNPALRLIGVEYLTTREALEIERAKSAAEEAEKKRIKMEASAKEAKRKRKSAQKAN